MVKIVLNKSNYFHNLKIISEKAESIDKVEVLVKDNTYRHSILEIAVPAKESEITNPVVKMVQEAVKFETFFSQILILADSNIKTYSHTFHILINSLNEIQRLPENTNVHLKVDSKMHLNGITLNSLEEASDGVQKKKLNLTGIRTHYRSADKLSCEFFSQRSVFRQIKCQTKMICEKLFLPIHKFHSANSYILFSFKNIHKDLVRVGIAFYGYIETNIIFKNPILKPKMSLWTKKNSTRNIKKNQKIGYSGLFLARNTIIKNIIALILLISSLNAAMTYQDAKEIENKFGVMKALSIYKSLAKEDNVEAMFRLAQLYSSGKTIKRSISKAKDLLQRASDLNHHKSTYNLGKIYLSEKTSYYDLTNAFNTFLKAANNGYAPAQNMIGQFLTKGIVVDKDYKMAVKYFERASKQDYIDAQCNLSFMYASGKGVFPNFGRANQFAKKGLSLGNKKCKKVWEEYNLQKYNEDKGWKFNFYTKPE